MINGFLAYFTFKNGVFILLSGVVLIGATIVGEYTKTFTLPEFLTRYGGNLDIVGLVFIMIALSRWLAERK